MSEAFKRVNHVANAAVDRLYEMMQPMGRGDVLTFEVLDEVIGGERHRHPWALVIKKLKRRLLEERGITLKNAQMVGYYLAPVDEQIAQGADRTREAARRIGWGIKHVDATPDEELTLPSRQRKIGVVHGLTGLLKTVKQQERVQKYLARVKDVNPRLTMNLDDHDELARIAGAG